MVLPPVVMAFDLSVVIAFGGLARAYSSLDLKIPISFPKEILNKATLVVRVEEYLASIVLNDRKPKARWES